MCGAVFDPDARYSMLDGTNSVSTRLTANWSGASSARRDTAPDTEQLVREAGIGWRRERRLLLEQLARLTARGELVKTELEQWALPEQRSTRRRVSRAARRNHRRCVWSNARVATRDCLLGIPAERSSAMLNCPVAFVARFGCGAHSLAPDASSTIWPRTV